MHQIFFEELNKQHETECWTKDTNDLRNSGGGKMRYRRADVASWMGTIAGQQIGRIKCPEVYGKVPALCTASLAIIPPHIGNTSETAGRIQLPAARSAVCWRSRAWHSKTAMQMKQYHGSVERTDRNDEARLLKNCGVGETTGGGKEKAARMNISPKICKIRFQQFEIKAEWDLGENLNYFV